MDTFGPKIVFMCFEFYDFSVWGISYESIHHGTKNISKMICLKKNEDP